MARLGGFLTEIKLPTENADEDVIDDETCLAAMVDVSEEVIPTLDEGPKEVKGDTDVYAPYSTRGPRDVMLSGPLPGGYPPGRWFASRIDAAAWAITKYGVSRVVVPEAQSKNRWCLLIKELRVRD